MLKEISIEIIRKCPNNCIHCSSLSDMACKEILSFERFASIVEDAVALGAETVCLSGGEPFIHPQIVAMIDYVSAKHLNCYVYSSGIALDHSNNKAPLDTNMLASIAGKVSKIIFNIEAATEQTYDTVMGTKGCFELMKQSIVQANNLSITTEAHFVPMKLNIDEIDLVVNLCIELGISKISFLRLVLHGRAQENEAQIALSHDEFATLKVRLSRMRKAPNNLSIRIGVPLSEDSGCHKCEAARGKINIKYDGSVFPCEVFKNDRTGVQLNGYMPESICSRTFSEIYRTSPYLNYVRNYSLSYDCNQSGETCLGQYLISLIENGGDTYGR